MLGNTKEMNRILCILFPLTKKVNFFGQKLQTCPLELTNRIVLLVMQRGMEGGQSFSKLKRQIFGKINENKTRIGNLINFEVKGGRMDDAELKSLQFVMKEVETKSAINTHVIQTGNQESPKCYNFRFNHDVVLLVDSNLSKIKQWA